MTTRREGDDGSALAPVAAGDEPVAAADPPLQGASPPGALASRTVAGVAWAYGSYFVNRMLGLLFTALLARLLTPEVFGVVALCLVVVALLETFADLGLNSVLVVLRDTEHEVRAVASSVWWVAVGIGAVLGILIGATGPLAARFFDEPQLTALLPVLGLAFFVRSVASTHYALAQRSLDFRARTWAELSDVSVRGVVGVLLALGGLGAWSMVLGQLVGSLVFAAVLWAVVPWRPARRAPRRADIDRTLGFGSVLTLISIIAAIIANVDYVFVGRILGAEELGLYTLAFKLPEMLIINLSVVAGRVLMPAFAAVDRTAVAKSLVRAFHFGMLVTLPLAAGLALISEPLVLLVFGAEWRDAAPAMVVLSIYALCLAAEIPSGTVYKSIGRPGIVLMFAVPRLMSVVVLLLLFADEGIVTVGLIQAGVMAVFGALAIGVTVPVLGVSPAALWSALWPPLVATAAMAVPVVAIDRAVDGSLLTVALTVPAGALVYAGGLLLLARSSLTEIWELLPVPGRTRA